jgi:hypothetical protein
MGGGSWSDNSYDRLTTSYKTKSKEEIFVHTQTNTISSDMKPHGLKSRESRDSKDHPKSLAVAIFLDVTGSMGNIPDDIARHRMGDLMKTLMKHHIHDAHILFGGIGDHITDKYPLQIGQFEAETTLLNKWLTSINLEGGGGGQMRESYLLAWLFAARHTTIDCFEKRGQKGYLFTIGDEMSWDNVGPIDLKHLMGYKEISQISDIQILSEAKKKFHVFHLHVQQGDYRDDPNVLGYWKNLLGENFIKIDNYKKICEIIATIVATGQGVEIEHAVSTLDKTTAQTVRDILSPLINAFKNVEHKLLG